MLRRLKRWFYRLIGYRPVLVAVKYQPGRIGGFQVRYVPPGEDKPRVLAVEHGQEVSLPAGSRVEAILIETPMVGGGRSITVGDEASRIAGFRPDRLWTWEEDRS